MPVDLNAAEQFVLANGRLLERHQLAVLMHGAPVTSVLAALRAYRNPDGGFGHALEPDVRAPQSEPAAALHALEVLIDIDAPGDPMIADAANWVAGIAGADGGVPFVLPSAADHPHAPWMVPSAGGSHLTFAIAGALWASGTEVPWRQLGSDWCWTRLEDAQALGGYSVKFALDFLDRVDDAPRAVAAIERLRAQLDEDGSLPVAAGTEHERLTPLTLSARPNRRSRSLFSPEQINADLDRLERTQQPDGGWEFDWLAWSPGQSVEWRGILTLQALRTLTAHGRLPSLQG
jgi:hypothetical protein